MLAKLEDGVALNPDEVKYLSVREEGSQAAGRAYSVVAKFDAIDPLMPVRRFKDRKAAQAAVKAYTRTLNDAADDEELICWVGRGVAVKRQDTKVVQVRSEKVFRDGAQVAVFSLVARIDGENRPVLLSTCDDGEVAVSRASKIIRALSTDDRPMVDLGAGVGLEPSEIKYLRVRTDKMVRGAETVELSTLVAKLESDERLMPISAHETSAAAEAAAQAAADALNATEEVTMAVLAGGLGVLTDDVRFLHVRREQAVGGGTQFVVEVSLVGEERPVQVQTLGDAATAEMMAEICLGLLNGDEDD